MNEYTRREEVLWTLVTVAILVPAVAIAIIRLVFVQGDLVQNPAAIEAAKTARQRATDFEKCSKIAASLRDEVDIFKKRAEGAKKQAEQLVKTENALPKWRRRSPDDKELQPQIPWFPKVRKYSQELAPCHTPAINAAGARAEADPAWEAVRMAAAISPPTQGDKDAELAAGQKLDRVFGKVALDKLVAHVTDAKAQLTRTADEAETTASNEKIRQPIPDGLFPRGAAIGAGVGIALTALIISYISVRSVSRRRAKTLIGLRRFANTPEAGLQAAAIVRLAAHHNGGEPGMVAGASIGGLVAAIFVPMVDKNLFIGDLFVAGAMGGLLFGLAMQWLVRTLAGVGRWRERVKELGSLEKPTVPMQLVLGGVTKGLEKQFLRYFEALPLADAAVVVQKLAAQAENQILAAADAAAAQPQPAAPGGAAWPGGQAAGGQLPGGQLPGGQAPGGLPGPPGGPNPTGGQY